jgi:hypothetical protein
MLVRRVSTGMTSTPGSTTSVGGVGSVASGAMGSVRINSGVGVAGRGVGAVAQPVKSTETITNTLKKDPADFITLSPFSHSTNNNRQKR